MKTKMILAIVGSLAVAATSADAKPGAGANKNKDKGKGPSPHAQQGGKPAGPAAKDKAFKPHQIAKFRDTERREIVDYFGRFRDQEGGLPPGLAKNLRRGKPLPPGWRDKLTPGWRISDAWWPSFSPVPTSWFPRIRPTPNTGLYLYGDRVVRVYEPRREVIEVIPLPR